jgi:hypothetical protein
MDSSPNLELTIIKSPGEKDVIVELQGLFRSSGWTVLTDFIVSFLQIDTNYIYCVKIDEKIASCLFLSDYQNRAWMGYSCTKIGFRKMGLNSFLKNSAIKTYQKPIFLVCADSLVPYNKKLGFSEVTIILELVVEGGSSVQSFVRDPEIDEILAFDRMILGGSRDDKLRSILARSGTRSFAVWECGELMAYCMYSQINGLYRLGPLVFKEIVYGVRLLETAIETLGCESVTIHVSNYHLDTLMKSSLIIATVREVKLMATSNEYTLELTNQLAIYGKATG